jgi:hypothetical protein
MCKPNHQAEKKYYSGHRFSRVRRHVTGHSVPDFSKEQIYLIIKCLQFQEKFISDHKMKVKVKVTLEQATKAQRESICIALRFLQLWR